MIRKKRIWISIKYFLYLLILIVLYAMQTTAGFFSFFGTLTHSLLDFPPSLRKIDVFRSAFSSVFWGSR